MWHAYRDRLGNYVLGLRHLLGLFLRDHFLKACFKSLSLPLFFGIQLFIVVSFELRLS